MPRFYLHIREGDRLLEDPDGSDLPDLAAAQAEALVSAQELLAVKVRAGEVINGRSFEITDEAGEVQATLPFTAAIRFACPP